MKGHLLCPFLQDVILVYEPDWPIGFYTTIIPGSRRTRCISRICI